ncbi:nitrogen fixation protein NifQ [Burkholderia vietnamiensis]|uniref:nitrogen fixation protein NifQ n=1 Tax=Burkholderia vietnamiensis TaxID=60552 RepID=UPI0015930204|nr:nitrogen fixation protein NifQ [Burkholderia vietnamiensis]MBR8086737.1 nitrogen fixation protein NifQ [Burkholderia vietnamiensis]MCA8184299.1 nitrogen fixation protein NifQ [Burkholderia vietnamiensis]MDN8035686.1 nitrogen fixation protein NifQ [Burkholderia vietnamiensis]MDN8112801.1 nitrogen fixation protein NifQ [Burkholderia vietnamiensis]HDR9001562.1 nitrogen fixation protein NifQ [Burkholderia vietnamiensis]
MDVRAILMRCAVDAQDPTVLAFVGPLAVAFARGEADAATIAGLDATDTSRVLDRWFPGARAALAACAESPGAALPPMHTQPHTPRDDEFDDLVALFVEHADSDAGTRDEARCVAHVLAAACAGDNHLWQDLLLPSRRELSALIGRWFPRLAAKNTRDMKWKKFFYKQLCEREGLFVCKAPSCGACADYAHCFGPE